MNKFVLDASALLALLNGEEGADQVEAILNNSIISSVNLAEVVTRLSAVGIPDNEIHRVLGVLGLVIIPFDEGSAYIAGELYAHTSPLGLSLGDRACLALAQQEGVTAITADRAWADLELDIKVDLIR